MPDGMVRVSVGGKECPRSCLSCRMTDQEREELVALIGRRQKGIHFSTLQGEQT